MFGYPESYNLSMFDDSGTGLAKAFDLLGNTVVVPVVKAVAEKLCDAYKNRKEWNKKARILDDVFSLFITIT